MTEAGGRSLFVLQREQKAGGPAGASDLSASARRRPEPEHFHLKLPAHRHGSTLKSTFLRTTAGLCFTLATLFSSLLHFLASIRSLKVKQEEETQTPAWCRLFFSPSHLCRYLLQLFVFLQVGHPGWSSDSGSSWNTETWRQESQIYHVSKESFNAFNSFNPLLRGGYPTIVL